MSKVIHTRVDDDIAEMIERESSRTGKSVAQVLRDACLTHFTKRPENASRDAMDARMAELARDIDEKLSAMQEALKREIRERYRIPSFREYRIFYDLEIEPIPNNDLDSYDFYSWMLRCAKAYWRRYGKWPTPADARQFGNSSRRFEWPNSPTKE
ncbi:hypothetical protein [Tepidimonas charontis]|uniref:Uncharacterized protein n=1 Tax=Tepidimonas charontis TaxID=2267262 RepID=A0A554X8F7_9BURK|nr:hypothetical protein [Tepidimonas charontis]TSE32112.1 hypothetical protein Tchar_02199 [Tepidimonas charontis]